MIRFLHAGDFHLDSPFASLSGEQAALRRREQRSQLREIGALAADCDLVFLAGDLLDSARAYGETLEALEEFFAGIRAHVFIAPGNHDYYTPQSPYGRMTLPDNVHLFTSPRPEAVELPELGCTVWGMAFTAARSRARLEGFRVPEDGKTHFMVLHGDALMPDSPYNPISREEIAESGLTYLALGHVHSYSGPRREGATLWAYPGCTLGRGFDETGEKGLILGQAEGQACSIRFQPLSGRRYEILPVDVTEAESLEGALRAALPADASGQIFRLILRGEWEEKPALEALEEALKDCCWHLSLRDETRLRQDLWEKAGEDTLRGNFLRILRERYQTAEEAEKEKIMLAARFGLAALDYREEL